MTMWHPKHLSHTPLNMTHLFFSIHLLLIRGLLEVPPHGQEIFYHPPVFRSTSTSTYMWCWYLVFLQRKRLQHNTIRLCANIWSIQWWSILLPFFIHSVAHSTFSSSSVKPFQGLAFIAIAHLLAWKSNKQVHRKLYSINSPSLAVFNKTCLIVVAVPPYPRHIFFTHLTWRLSFHPGKLKNSPGQVTVFL